MDQFVEKIDLIDLWDLVIFSLKFYFFKDSKMTLFVEKVKKFVTYLGKAKVKLDTLSLT